MFEGKSAVPRHGTFALGQAPKWFFQVYISDITTVMESIITYMFTMFYTKLDPYILVFSPAGLYGGAARPGKFSLEYPQKCISETYFLDISKQSSLISDSQL